MLLVYSIATGGLIRKLKKKFMKSAKLFPEVGNSDEMPKSKIKSGDPTLRFIEVKGRAAGSTTVTVTKNEILTALNKIDEYILAIVEVDGTQTKTIYLKKPFRERPDFAATSVNYDIMELIVNAEIILQK